MTKPKQNSGHKKESRIYIRATAKEKAQLQVKAEASGMTLAEYLINSGLNKKIANVTPAIDKSLYLELCRQGNNLNQLARLQDAQIAASNKSFQLHPDERAMLEKIYNLLRQTLSQLQEKKVS
ncbi:hypothetical protein [Pleurocapsa sp. PCC 7319]|uniref:plasmid mobilization protein n=1 Tax=Pleurocapsa sp. PCC 7319 TaxID=118161 RepID=UPI00034AEAB7|nr:hypothetical protein [Pleurocapsa sp. PCC 7319]